MIAIIVAAQHLYLPCTGVIKMKSAAYTVVLKHLLVLLCLRRVYTGDWHGGVRHGRCVPVQYCVYL
jgi:hypothetical protein